MTKKPLQLAVLISGGGRTLLNLHEQIRTGDLQAEIQTVISSRGDAAGVKRAQDAGMSVQIISPRDSNDASGASFHDRLYEAVSGVDLVCMAGFLSMWHIPDEMIGRVMNIHPALLPDYGGPGMYGIRVHEAVIRDRREVSGCTVHFCDHQYDHGPIILQREVSVYTNDSTQSLADRVFVQECIAYPKAIQLFHENRLILQGGMVTII